MYDISLAALTLLSDGPLATVRAASEAGYDGYGLRLFRFGDDDVDILADAALMKNIIHETRAGVPMVDLEVLDIGEKPSRDLVVRALDFASECGARFLVAISTEPDRTKNAEHLAEVADLCAPYHVTALVEFVAQRTAIQSVKEAVAVVDEAARPNVALCIDALHMHRAGQQPSDLAAVADKVGVLQLCDTGPGQLSGDPLRYESRANRRYPGEGILPIFELLDRLPQTIPLSVEAPFAADAGLPPVDRARRALDATRRLLDVYVSRGRQSLTTHPGAPNADR